MDNCIICGKPKGRNKYYCSKACYSRSRQHTKICAICGKEFNSSPSDKVKCCSPACSSEYRRNQHNIDGIYDSNFKAMIKGRKDFFDKYNGDKHFLSKHWVIESPDGKVYECQNLMHFIKNNPDLFDGTPKQAYNGIIKIKAGLRGKISRPAYSWKGWRLLDWDDDIYIHTTN